MANTMNVSLTPELIEHVNKLVESGLYNNQSEVLRAALRLMIERENDQALRLAALRAQIKVGLDELDRGEGISLTAEDIIAKAKSMARDKAS